MNLVQWLSDRSAPILPACFGLVPALLLAGACATGDDGGGRESATVGFSGGGGILTLTSATSPTTGDATGSSDGSTAGGSTQAGDDTQGVTTGVPTTGAPDGTTAEDTGDGAMSGGGPKFDLAAHPDGGAPPPEAKACVNVDLLFVVDNSGSMKEEQMNLAASFPSFVNEIQKELADAESLHIGVVSTDGYEYNDLGCSGVLGGLVTQTGGANSSNAKCGPYGSGKRFMTEKDNLPMSFACAAQVGTDGDGDEKPIDAALYALGPGLAAPGACNEGFVRDDALLVLVLITDEEEEASVGDPPQWFNSLVALRGGVETNIVVLSIIGPQQPQCQDASEIGYRLIEFTEMFTYGSVGEICAGSYQKFFHDSIAGIVQACDGFMPPG